MDVAFCQFQNKNTVHTEPANGVRKKSPRKKTSREGSGVRLGLG